jgi:hypothetical protein
MLVVRECDYLGMMWRIIITKNTLSFAQVSLGVADSDRITQFSAYYLVDIQVRFIPKMDSAAEQSIVIV